MYAINWKTDNLVAYIWREGVIASFMGLLKVKTYETEQPDQCSLEG